MDYQKIKIRDNKINIGNVNNVGYQYDLIRRIFKK